MSLDFKSGSYTVQTGKTFMDPSNASHDFYTLRFNSKLDPSMPSRKASLRQDKDTYYADWNMPDSVLSYEGTKGSLQELECLLVYDEETQTFTLERPTIKTTMKKARKKKPNGSMTDNNNNPSTSGKAPPLPSTPTKIKSSSSPSAMKRSSDWLATPPTTNDQPSQQRTSPITLALPPAQPPIQQKDTPTTSALDTTDSFDVDLLSEMDEILNSNDEDEFETITSPHQPPTFSSPQPVNNHLSSSPATTPNNKRRRQAVKMASAPIRRLDASPPTPAPQTNQRAHVGGKTISAETLAARRKAASAIRADSSSGSSSSDSSSEDDDTSGSSGSDSDSDMDSLAANISRGLSEEVSPYANVTPISSGQAGPRSLRDLLDGNQRDDDDVSSSGSSSDDDG